MMKNAFREPHAADHQKVFRRGATILGAALLVSLRVQSADMPSDTGLSEQLKKLSFEELLEVKVAKVFAASKHEQKTTEAPASVSIVTRNEIQQYGHRTLADILRSVRGFYVTDDRGYHHIGSRGFNRLGDYGGRILLMVDGHRLNDGIFNTTAGGTDFPLDLDLIERVEVIRGPGSSLYGDNAFFGVINVITRRGRDLDGAELSGSYGSFDTWTGRASYGQRFTNGVELLLSGTLHESTGHERLSYPEFVAENLDGGWARNAFASVSYRDLTLQGGFSRRQKDWPTAAYYTVPNSQEPRLVSLDERAWADLTFRRELANDWLVTARAYFDRYLYDADYPYDYDEDPSTTPDLNRDRATALTAGLEFSIRKSLWERHEFITGWEWRHDFELAQRNWDVAPFEESLNSDESADILGLYVQDEWSIRPNLIVNAGVRYDYYSAFGKTVNPRAAFIYTPWQPSTFKLLYGQAFRAPNAYESFYQSFGTMANPSLQPETIRSYEWVWEQRLGPHWRTSVSAFWNDVQDLINQVQLDVDADPATLDDDFFQMQNTGAAASRGVELEVQSTLAWGLRALASYTFADTQDEVTGLTLDNAPQHLGKLNVTIPLWHEKVFGGLELQAMSNRRTVTGDETDPFVLVNFTLFSRELIKGLEFAASIYNLFDKHYADPVSADFGYMGPISGNDITLGRIQQDDRSFRVKLTYRF